MELLIKNFLAALEVLVKNIFACYLNVDYLERQYEYDKKIHVARKNILLIMRALRKKNQNIQFLDDLARFYQIIFSLNLLKYRVKDHATFEVCENEFKKIFFAIERVVMMEKQSRNSTESINEFSQAIESFADLYRNTIQVITQDPNVFLFFLQDLFSLRDLMIKMWVK